MHIVHVTVPSMYIMGLVNQKQNILIFFAFTSVDFIHSLESVGGTFITNILLFPKWIFLADDLM